MATLIALILVGAPLGWSGWWGGMLWGWELGHPMLHQWPHWPEPSLWGNAAQCRHMDRDMGHQPGVFQAPFRSPGS